MLYMRKVRKAHRYGERDCTAPRSEKLLEALPQAILPACRRTLSTRVPRWQLESGRAEHGLRGQSTALILLFLVLLENSLVVLARLLAAFD
jgi:hypothetical protein